MNWGQFAEMFFMLLIPMALARLGIKKALLVGLIALLVRYVAFLCGSKFDQEWLYFIAILVHGIIFGFFFVGGQIYIDKKAPKEIRAQAQGFIFLVTFGIGLLIGNFFNGELIARNVTEQIIDGATVRVYNWDTIWTVTTIISLVLPAVFLIFFKDKILTNEQATGEVQNT
jgi:MFS family permease